MSAFYDRDDNRAYEAWLEHREQQLADEEQAAWEEEIDEYCSCVYEDGKQYYRYYAWTSVEPLTVCDWHKAQAAAQAAKEAAEWEQEMKWADEAAAVTEKADAVADMAERAGIELPAGYVTSKAPLPRFDYYQPWYSQILYVRERLYILEGSGLGTERRVKLIGDMFSYLAEPENFDLLRVNDMIRAVTATKLAEFRDDPRAAPIADVMRRLEKMIAAC